MSITQAYRGAVSMGSAPLRMPALPGSRLSMPKNYQLPPVAHNMAFQYLYAEGLQVPSVDLDTCVNSNWFTAANLKAWFITRTLDDLAIVAGSSDYGMELMDGATRYKMKNAKGNSLILGSSPGSLIQCRMNFMGTDLATGSATTYLVITDEPVMYDKVAFSGGITGDDVAGWQLMLTNNCIPHPGHPGSVHPSEINAQQFIGTLRLTLHAAAAVPTNGAAITITFGTTVPVVFTLNNPLLMAPQELAIQRGPAFRQYDLTLLGGNTGSGAPYGGTELCPVTIA